MPEERPGHWLTDWTKHIRFGAGLVGKTSYVAVAFCIVAVAALVFLPADQKIWGLILAAATIIPYFYFTFRFAEKHPILSAMDGMDAVNYLTADQAAKNAKVIDLAPNGTANTAPPVAITSSGPAAYSGSEE